MTRRGLTVIDMAFNKKTRAVILQGVVAGLVFLLQTVSPQILTASAQTTTIPVYSLTQQDLNGDGAADVTVIETAFATERDRVLVYDRQGDMPWGSEWQDVTDFRDDVWIYDVGADGTAQLIVVFDVVDEQYVAMIYDDADGDGVVSYHLDGRQVAIDESDFWYVQVMAGRYWTEYDTLPHKDLTILMDGAPGGLRDDANIAQLVSQDGVIDWEYNVGDKDGDGVNDYQLSYALAPPLRSSSYVEGKATIRVQANNSRPTPYADTLFWPMLKTEHASGNYRYFDYPPVVTVDWEKGRVSQLGILGFPIEAGYHIYSRVPLSKDAVNALNWENPIAYYDLAHNQNGRAELAVRFDVIIPFDPIFGGPAYAGKIATPSVEVNYTWDQNNDGRVDYKMNLAANHPIEQVVEFPDFAVKSVPYDEIVPWVRGNTWDVAMLVHHVEGTTDGEAMYGQGWLIERGYQDGSYFAPTGLQSLYMRGLTDRYPIERYQDIDEGMRGEYNFEYFDTPKIYLGALDRQLHLFTAQGGVWNLGEGRYIRYANLDGDPYLDQWQEEQDGAVVQQVNYGRGVYVHNRKGNVQIKLTDAGSALLETQPPGNHEEWQHLDAQLQASQINVKPEDFSGMLSLLSGPAMEIHGAEATGYRPTNQGGFRFVLELTPDYRVSGIDLLGLDGIAPGRYVVENHSGAFTVAPLSPAQLNLDLRQPGGNTIPQVQVIVGNTGLADASNLTLVVEAQDDDGSSVELTRTPVQALAGETVQVKVDIPSFLAAGRALYGRLEDDQGSVVATGEWIALASLEPSYRTAIFGLDQTPLLLPVIGLFAAFVATAGLLALSRWRGHSSA